MKWLKGCSFIQMPHTSTELRWTCGVHVPESPLNQLAQPTSWQEEDGLISWWVPSKGQPAMRRNHCIMDEMCLRKFGQHGNTVRGCLWLISWWEHVLQITCWLLVKGGGMAVHFSQEDDLSEMLYAGCTGCTFNIKITLNIAKIWILNWIHLNQKGHAELQDPQ